MPRGPQSRSVAPWSLNSRRNDTLPPMQRSLSGFWGHLPLLLEMVRFVAGSQYRETQDSSAKKLEIGPDATTSSASVAVDLRHSRLSAHSMHLAYISPVSANTASSGRVSNGSVPLAKSRLIGHTRNMDITNAGTSRLKRITCPMSGCAAGGNFMDPTIAPMAT